MNLKLTYLMIFLFTIGVGMGQSQTLDEYIKEAGKLQKTGEIDQSIIMMSEAIKKYPDKAIAYSYLGLFKGMKAGQVKDYMESFRFINESFEMLDKAISMDSDNPVPRYHRGLMGVNIPEFLGKLDLGIGDLEMIVKMSEDSPGKVSKDLVLNATNFLAQGYQKKKDKNRAISTWKKIIELAPDSDLAKRAKENIKKLSIEKPAKSKIKKKPDSEKISKLKQKVENDPDNPSLLNELGKAYLDEKDFEAARKILEETIKLDPKHIEAYKLLAMTIGELAAKGYDERIHEDTDLRTNLAFTASKIIDKACELAPEDIELRLQRGIVGVGMPFFVNKLDQGIADLKWVLKSQTTYETKATAHFWLGRAYQKKAMSYWIKVVSDYSKSKAYQDVFNGLYPKMKRLDASSIRLPALTIDFIVGFQDELAPQTAVWIENKKNEFIKTIYVSGFSGYAKEQQVNLSSWTDASNFVDVDGVTSASIDLGHHVYVWDLKNHNGENVRPGEYIVKVEVAYWPSMEYQLVSTSIDVGKGKTSSLKKEGDLIPYLEVKYYPVDNK